MLQQQSLTKSNKPHETMIREFLMADVQEAASLVLKDPLVINLAMLMSKDKPHPQLDDVIAFSQDLSSTY